jgi:2-dehydro-3-deoxygalactonokinase
LSGLVIGEELRAQTLQRNTEVIIIGSASLTQRYHQALALQHVQAQCVGSQANWAGLWAIAQTVPANLPQQP